MTYPQQYPQQGYPQAPPPGYPQQYPPQYPQPYPQQPGYGQAMPMPAPTPPPPPRQQWRGGAAFNAQQQEYENRDSLTFKGAPPGTTRTLVNDKNPVVIHGTDFATKQPDYDKKGNPKWTVGTPYIDERGQKVTFWCGLYSKAAQKMTAARQARGIGPEDSMIGWVSFIRFTGMVQTNSGEARDYEILVMPLQEARQYLTPQQVQAVQAEGIQMRQPGNLECREAAAPASEPAPVQQPSQTGQLFHPAGGPGGMVPSTPVPADPWAGQQAPGSPPAAPGWPQAAPYDQGGQMAPGDPYGSPAPQQAPPGAFPGSPPDPMAQAVSTFAQHLGGQVISQQAPQVAPDGSFMGFQMTALAQYSGMSDPMIASLGHNPQQVRAAVQQAQAQGLLPQGPGGPQPTPQGPPGGFPQGGQTQDPPF